MRILLVHNRYRLPGGEDSAFENECELLRGAGHDVQTFVRSNQDIESLGVIRVAAGATWSRKSHQAIAALLDDYKPNIVHCHNTFPLVSPSVYFAANARHVPVVQTLHNFRLTCLNGMLFRDGSVCTDCVDRLPWRGVVRACYQGARPQSAVVALTVSLHRAIGTYNSRVDAYIALSEAAKSTFIVAGLPADKIHVKPNFVDVSRAGLPDRSSPRHGVLFVGRLSKEKGIDTLSRVARQLTHVRFKVIGDGPEMFQLRGIENVELLGHRGRDFVLSSMRESQCLIVPSLCFEGFPLVIAEAFASGLPAIASKLGSLADIVTDGVTGLLCTPGDHSSFSRAISTLLSDSGRMQSMSSSAQDFYDANLNPAANLRALEAIYVAAMSRRAST